MLIIALSLFLISCDSNPTYQEIEIINQISISKGNDFKEPVENFDILITEEEILNKARSFINSAKKYHKKNTNNIIYNDYVVELNYNDDITSRLLFFFPEDKESEAGCFFYYIGYEDHIFSLSKLYTDELINLFLGYGHLEEIDKIILASKKNFESKSLQPSIYIEDKDKIRSFKDIIENSSLDYSSDCMDCIDYIIDLEYKDSSIKTEPFVFSVPNKKNPISFYQIGYEDLVYQIEDELSEVIRDILFER